MSKDYCSEKVSSEVEVHKELNCINGKTTAIHRLLESLLHVKMAAAYGEQGTKLKEHLHQIPPSRNRYNPIKSEAKIDVY